MQPEATPSVAWGILSSAAIGLHRIIPAIAASRNGTLQAIGTPRPERVREVAERYRIAHVYQSYEEVLADPVVEAVYNPLPNALHHEWTRRALNAGKHVLCEKPFTLTPAEAAELVDLAHQQGRQLMEAFMYRFHPQQERVRQLLDDDAIGPVRLVRASFTFVLPPNPQNIRYSRGLGGGALMDVGCYCLNAIRAYAGEPEAVQATMVLDPETEVDVTTMGQLECGEALALFDCSYAMAGHIQLEIMGTCGRIEVPRCWLPGEGPATLWLTTGSDTKEIQIPGVDQYQLQVEHFADAIRGREPLRLPPEDALQNTRVIEAVRRAATHGCRVALSEIEP
ncbi:MAG: Gfo/Idh/MocA family oxidoreductase [Armatimonadetes bacterium]|nr:Gfo/Idh/MocA family oxidoreductase [Armatimonadota bacterium]